MSADVVSVRCAQRPVTLAEALALSLACATLRALGPHAESVAKALEQEAQYGRERLRVQCDRCSWYLDGLADGTGSRTETAWTRAWDAVTRLLEVVS